MCVLQLIGFGSVVLNLDNLIHIMFVFCLLTNHISYTPTFEMPNRTAIWICSSSAWRSKRKLVLCGRSIHFSFQTPYSSKMRVEVLWLHSFVLSIILVPSELKFRNQRLSILLSASFFPSNNPSSVHYLRIICIKGSGHVSSSTPLGCSTIFRMSIGRNTHVAAAAGNFELSSSHNLYICKSMAAGN